MHLEPPLDWSEVRLRDLLVLVRNGTTATQVDEPTPYPVTRIETISEGTIDFSKVGYLAKPELQHRLSKGDILYSHINSVDHIGKVAKYDGSNVLYHGMNLMLLRPRTSVVDPVTCPRLLVHLF